VVSFDSFESIPEVVRARRSRARRVFVESGHATMQRRIQVAARSLPVWGEPWATSRCHGSAAQPRVTRDSRSLKGLLAGRLHLLPALQRSAEGVRVGVLQVTSDGQTPRQPRDPDPRCLDKARQIHGCRFAF
jgi:hypothetical protein